MENLGIDPSTSRMQNEHSTVWANSLVLENLGEKISPLSAVIARVLNKNAV